MTKERRAARKAAGQCTGSDACQQPPRPGKQTCERHARMTAERQARYNRREYKARIDDARCRRCGRDDLETESLCPRCTRDSEKLTRSRQPEPERQHHCGACGARGHKANGRRCPMRFGSLSLAEFATARNAA